MGYVASGGSLRNKRSRVLLQTKKRGEIDVFRVLLLAGVTWNELNGKPNPEAELDPLASRVCVGLWFAGWAKINLGT